MINKTDLDKFARDSLPILEKFGYIKPKKKSSFAIFFLLGIIFTGVLLYGFQTDAFKSEITQDVFIEPKIDVNNEYEFSTPVQVDNNYTFTPNITIVNNVLCPTT